MQFECPVWSVVNQLYLLRLRAATGFFTQPRWEHQKLGEVKWKILLEQLEFVQESCPKLGVTALSRKTHEKVPCWDLPIPQLPGDQVSI